MSDVVVIELPDVEKCGKYVRETDGGLEIGCGRVKGHTGRCASPAGYLNLIDQQRQRIAELEAALNLMMQAFDSTWPGACYDDCFEEFDGHGYEMQDIARSAGRAALKGRA